MEYLNLYDSEGNLLKERGIRKQKNNALVGVSIIFIENSEGEFLIQKTSPSRGGVYATTGGHVEYGSNFYDTIIREVNEELGIDISKDDIKEVSSHAGEYYFQKVYYLKKDIDISDIKIQEDEVEFVKWMSKDEINKLIELGEFREGNIPGYKDVVGGSYGTCRI